MIDLKPHHLDEVKQILVEHVPGCEVRAFGSRAKWTAREYSDLDLAVVGDGLLDWRILGKVQDAFEESDLPITVDLLEWYSTAESFRRLIESDYTVVSERDGSDRVAEGRRQPWPPPRSRPRTSGPDPGARSLRNDENAKSLRRRPPVGPSPRTCLCGLVGPWWAWLNAPDRLRGSERDPSIPARAGVGNMIPARSGRYRKTDRWCSRLPTSVRHRCDRISPFLAMHFGRGRTPGAGPSINRPTISGSSDTHSHPAH